MVLPWTSVVVTLSTGRVAVGSGHTLYQLQSLQRGGGRRFGVSLSGSMPGRASRRVNANSQTARNTPTAQGKWFALLAAAGPVHFCSL